MSVYYCNQLTWLIAREDFIECVISSHHCFQCTVHCGIYDSAVYSDITMVSRKRCIQLNYIMLLCIAQAVVGKTALGSHKAARINVLGHRVINIDRQRARVRIMM